MANNRYNIGDPEIDGLIDSLTEVSASGECREMFRQILTTVTKLAMEHVDLGDFKLTNTTVKELRHSFRVFHANRKVRKVTVFGSARTALDDPDYALTENLCRMLVDKGFMIISGGGPGIMEAANKGACEGNSFGLNIQLPFEQSANPYIDGDPKLVNYKYFFTRKLFFIKESDATVLLPGGFGTQDEGFENLTLFQTGKTLPRPIVLLEAPDGTYWPSWIEFVDSVLVKKGYISPEDRHLFQLAHSPQEATRIIQDYYHVYHSLRYVRSRTIMRFNKEIPASLVSRLNAEFKDILVDGVIEPSLPLEDEKINQEHLDLPRLVLNFNQKSFGRLNQMIQTINRDFA